MRTAAECLGKAEECELMAAELHDPEQRREWLRMACEWRVAATLAHPDDPPGDPQSGGAGTTFGWWETRRSGR